MQGSAEQYEWALRLHRDAMLYGVLAMGVVVGLGHLQIGDATRARRSPTVWLGVLGLASWPESRARRPRPSLNAIAHQDFSKVGGQALRLAQGRRWRVNCNVLATAFDEVLARRVRALVGSRPW